MRHDYWLTCQDCQHDWVGRPYDTRDGEEKCPECSSDNFEIGDQYRSREWPDPSVTFYAILLIPNFLLFWT